MKCSFLVGMECVMMSGKRERREREREKEKTQGISRLIVTDYVEM